MSIFDAITRPVRGLGRILRGDFKRGIADIGAGVSGAGKVVGFANPVLGGAMVAGGSLADKVDDPGGIGGTKLFKEIIAPAALTTGAGYASKGLGSLLKGSEAGTELASEVPQYGMEGATTADMAGTAMSAAPKMGMGQTLLNAGKSAGNYLVQHPLEAGMLGLNAYGQYQQGKAYDEEIERDRRKRRAWSDLLMPVFQR